MYTTAEQSCRSEAIKGAKRKEVPFVAHFAVAVMAVFVPLQYCCKGNQKD